MKLLMVMLMAWATLAPALDWSEYEPLYVHHQLEFADETYSVFVIQPRNVRRLLDTQLNKMDRERLRQKLWHNRAETGTLLFNAQQFVRSVYFDRGVFTQRTGPGLTGGLKDLQSGRYPLILITKYNDPFQIYQTVSFGLDFGEGIPTELRCVGRGMEWLPRPLVRQAKVQVRHLPELGELAFDAEVEKILSEMTRVVGSVAEVKTFTKARYSKYDFGPLVHRLTLAHRLHFWGGEAIPEFLRPAPPSSERQKLLEALKAKHPELPDEILFPHLQERVVNERLFIRAGRPGLVRVYNHQFGFGPPWQSFTDPDFATVVSHVLGIERTDLEQTTSDLLAQRPDFKLVKDGVIRINDFEALSCSRILHLNDFKKRSARPGAYVGGIRLMDIRHHTVPPDSWLNRKY